MSDAEPDPGTAPGVHAALSAAGNLRFDRLWDLALYQPEAGFYDTGGAAGRRGDFLTSVELGPLFGACLAERLDRDWDAAGQPDTWTLVDAGAGPGTLVRAVLAAQPRCAAVLDAVLVERSANQRSRHRELTDWAAARGVGVVSQAELPERISGLIIAHELLDNLAARVVQRSGGQAQELWATLGSGPAEHGPPAGSDAAAIELSWRPIDGADAARLEAFDWWGDVPDEAPVPWNEEANRWVTDARPRIETGTLLAVDYGARTTAELAGRDGWLRTYAGGAVGTDPLEDLGHRDLTSDVGFDQLPPPDRLTTQAEALGEWGIEELVRSARRRIAERPGVMDLAWARDTSVLNEAPALVDPAGLGAFLVAEWDRRA